MLDRLRTASIDIDLDVPVVGSKGNLGETPVLTWLSHSVKVVIIEHPIDVRRWKRKAGEVVSPSAASGNHMLANLIGREVVNAVGLEKVCQ